jgi:hypothetical protein
MSASDILCIQEEWEGRIATRQNCSPVVSFSRLGFRVSCKSWLVTHQNKWWLNRPVQASPDCRRWLWQAFCGLRWSAGWGRLYTDRPQRVTGTSCLTARLSARMAWCWTEPRSATDSTSTADRLLSLSPIYIFQIARGKFIICITR